MVKREVYFPNESEKKGRRSVMKVVNHLSYHGEYGFRGLGDLYLPDSVNSRTRAALLIHGGGWSALDKSSFAGVALYLCQDLGMAVYNINYRLCGQAPWPACGDDCLEAGTFFLNASIPDFEGFDRSRIVIVGASAGGHLALMTGLRLPAERVAGIVSISGIADIRSDFSLHPDRYVSAQPAPSGFEADSVVCSSTTPNEWENGMGREGRDYWEAQLSEYWDSGLDDSRIQRTERTSLRKYPSLDPSVAKGVSSSLAATCKANGICFRKWLEDVLPRLTTTPAGQIDLLIPKGEAK